MMIITKDNNYNLIIENKELIIKHLYIHFKCKKDIFEGIKLLKKKKVIEVIKSSYYSNKYKIVYSNNNIEKIKELFN